MRRRRGANAIEFALVSPLFVFVVAAIFEYSWLFYMRAAVLEAARSGCRDGAVVPLTEDPQSSATLSILAQLSERSFFGIDCEDPEDPRCLVLVDTSGDPPTQLITCTVQLSYPGLTGVLPVPPLVEAHAISLFELQR